MGVSPLFHRFPSLPFLSACGNWQNTQYASLEGGGRIGILKASEWLEVLEGPSGGTLQVLQDVYGSDGSCIAHRIRLFRETIAVFQERFGDRDCRLFRCPGRVNLRGMHVDSHGGYLNLMTHHREVVFVAAPAQDNRFTFANTDPIFEEEEFSWEELPGAGLLEGEWEDMVQDASVREAVVSRQGHWGNYLRGCVLCLRALFHSTEYFGVRGVIGSDLPCGAGLSSSSALCVAVCQGIASFNDFELNAPSLIRAVQHAEWYTGARTGTSDQGAMVLGGLGEMINVVLHPNDLESAAPQRLPFPEKDLHVVIINSFVKRSLSGDDLAAYAKNRFAYSLALEIIRQELLARDMRRGLVDSVDRLSRVTPELFGGDKGRLDLYELIASIPKSISVEQLGLLYDLPYLEDTYDFYFSAIPEKDRPDIIEMRGPIFYGIAESERARMFSRALNQGDFKTMGELMTIGHNGDRRMTEGGEEYSFDVSDSALALLAKSGRPVYKCPGVFGASLPVLDFIVDAAILGGALGASLTGAGLGGSVLALCTPEKLEVVMESVKRILQMEGYAILAGNDEIFDKQEVEGGVLVNRSVAAAGEIRLG